MSIIRWMVAVLACSMSLSGRECCATDSGVGYVTQVKPILRARCFSCHGGLKQQSGLRLDTVAAMLRGGKSGPVIAVADPLKSLLMQRVGATDPKRRMPPETADEPLSPAQVSLIRDWIAQGATAPDDEQPEADATGHWAFRPIARPPLPVESDKSWTRNPIDAYISRQHRTRGLKPQGDALTMLLLRRLYFDLIGLPPTAEEIASFERATSPEWYERTVDRLLDDPRHGERWARHWMDIWRYSDWWGLGDQLRRSQKHIWHWRDWIVESLNNDVPYDEMVRQMLAADELYPNDLDKLRATGYLARNYWLFNRNQWLDETVEHVSKGFLGLTMNCTKCHEHKYDPIEQVDFYRMRAFFEPYHVRLDVVPGQPDLNRDGIPRVFDGQPQTPTYRFVQGQEKNPDKSTPIAPGVPDFLEFDVVKVQPVTLPADAWQPQRRPWVIEDVLAAARQKVAAARAAVDAAHKKLAETRQRDSTASTGSPGLDSEAGDSRQELNVAEAASEAAQAELESIERRAEATRATWALADKPATDNAVLVETEREKRVLALLAERVLGVAKARHNVAVAQLALHRAAENARDAAQKKLQEARDSLAKAVTAAAAEVKQSDSYTPFAGASWTPTRFLFSGTDDPPVAFHPQSTGRRSALAKWITDRRNPLTARVAVNHLWMRHMGEPLVSTPFDFGRNGAHPTHPELLDWLAAELIESGWSMKHLHRLIVTSATYRMSSSISGAASSAALDPDNHSWWRRVPIRLESQLIRDAILAHAGTLERTMGGPPVHAAQQDGSHRRSLYFFHSNNERNLFLTTFDEALVTECYRREQSIVPQQALAMTNSKLVLDAAPLIAVRLSQVTADEATFIRRAFAVLLGIEPAQDEMDVSSSALGAWRQLPDGSPADARSRLVWALINHNDFVTLR